MLKMGTFKSFSNVLEDRRFLWEENFTNVKQLVQFDKV